MLQDMKQSMVGEAQEYWRWVHCSSWDSRPGTSCQYVVRGAILPPYMMHQTIQRQRQRDRVNKPRTHPNTHTDLHKEHACMYCQKVVCHLVTYTHPCTN
jgi:hypothetical protein